MASSASGLRALLTVQLSVFRFTASFSSQHTHFQCGRSSRSEMRHICEGGGETLKPRTFITVQLLGACLLYSTFCYELRAKSKE